MYLHNFSMTYADTVLTGRYSGAYAPTPKRSKGFVDLDAGIVDTADPTREADTKTESSDDGERSDPSEIDFADLMTTATAVPTDRNRAETRVSSTRELALADRLNDVGPAGDPGWTAALDTLRASGGENRGKWRRRAAIRSVAFEDTSRLGGNAVQLRLEHRVGACLAGSPRKT